MHAEKISEIIAHFIGYFDLAVDGARMRTPVTEGSAIGKQLALDTTPEDPRGDFGSNLNLLDYDPKLAYRDNPYTRFPETQGRGNNGDPDIDHSVPRPAPISFQSPGLFQDIPAPGPNLVVDPGPGSAIAHFAQVNFLFDDDFLDMTSHFHVQFDMTFVAPMLADYAGTAQAFTPLGMFHRTDSPEGIIQIAQDIHVFATNAANGEIVLPEGVGDNAFVLADQSIEGIYVNGELVETAPELDDYLPDRGLAELRQEPEPSDVSLEQHGTGANTLDVTAGANLVGNYAAIATANIAAPVMSVLGDYHQADVISQAYVYSDVVHHGLPLSGENGLSCAAEASTIAINLAQFNRYGLDEPQTTSPDEDAAPVFPDAWRVSVVEGDVNFIQWLEQYNFVTDNDQLTVTSMGCEVAVLTGGNTAFNLTSHLNLGLQYDLIIVGGDVYDLNVINQISVLYDNDWIASEAGAPQGGDIHTSGNLLWNQATITNVGENDRFESLPDYMVTTVNAIESGDPNMPWGLAHDPNFEGYESLNVLYITGNLYDLNYIKQVSVLGDADMVTRAASEVAYGDANAEVTVNTGANAVFNAAEIFDYDSIGDTTYLGGNLYSDAVLIQGGLLEHDDTLPQPGTNTLANEVIAFLGDDAVDGYQGADPNTIISQDDVSWHSASPVDAMQSMIA